MSSATDQAIEVIRRLIREGDLASGSRLPPEHELAAQLGLSRNTLREAVRALTAARVLDVRRGDGTYVTSLQPDLLLAGVASAVDLLQEDHALELLEVRRILEPAATALAARRIDAAGLAEVAEVLAAMTDTRGAIRIDQDIHFHALLAKAAGNRTLQTMLEGVCGTTVNVRTWHGALDESADVRAHEEHVAIFEAVAARDAPLAHAVAQVHVSNTERWYRAMLGSVHPGKDLAAV